MKNKKIPHRIKIFLFEEDKFISFKKKCKMYLYAWQRFQYAILESPISTCSSWWNIITPNIEKININSLSEMNDFLDEIISTEEYIFNNYNQSFNKIIPLLQKTFSEVEKWNIIKTDIFEEIRNLWDECIKIQHDISKNRYNRKHSMIKSISEKNDKAVELYKIISDKNKKNVKKSRTN